MRTLFRPWVLMIVVLSFTIAGCEGGPASESMDEPALALESCSESFTQSFEPARVSGGRHFYFDAAALSFLDDPAYAVKEIFLNTTLRGHYKGDDFEIPLAINGLQAAPTNGAAFYELTRYVSSDDTSNVRHKLHKLAVNGGVSIHGFMLKAKQNKGEVKFSLQGNSLFALKGILEITGSYSGSCPTPKPSESPTPDPTSTPTPSATPDPVAPVTQILSVEPSAPVTASNLISFSFESDQLGSSFFCSLDGASAELCSSPLVLSGLSNGPHVFHVYAQNSAGLVDATGDTHEWAVDLVAPSVFISNSASLPALSGQDSVEFQLIADDAGAVFRCSLDDAEYMPCNSAQSYSQLSEGVHLFKVLAVDALGNVGEQPAQFQWIIDLTPPQTYIVQAAPVEAVTRNTTMSLQFAATESAVFECSLDHAIYQSCQSPVEYTALAQGLHRIEVRSVDLAGNIGVPASYSWTVDLSAPQLVLGNVTPQAGSLSNAALISVEFTADEAASFFCTFDGGVNASCISPFQVPVLTDGNHELKLQARDAAGNLSEVMTLGWVTDARAPSLSFGAITPTAASRSNSNWLTAVVNASEESILSCSLDAQNLGISSSPVQLSALAEGAHELIVGGVDRAGNHAAPIKHSFTVDLTAPVTTLGSAVGAITHETSNVFVFSASEAATFECNLNGAGFNACTSPIQISGFADGEHYFRVRATDLAGNLGPVVSALWTVDLTAPVVTLTVSRSANASIQFGFSSNEAGSVFTCSLDGAAFTSCSSPLAFSGLAIGNHSFIVRASDPQGNSDPAGVSHAWTVEPLVTTKIISVVPSATFTNQRTANFSFDTNVGVNFICGLDGGALAPCVSPVSYAGLVDGLHNFLVYAIDRWDVQDPVGAQYSWTVDGTVPVVVSITHSYTRSSATINWTTNEPSSAQLNWGVGTDTSRLIPDNGIYSTAHTVTITGLSSNTQYAYIVGGRDQAGNSYQYTKRAFRTNP